MLLQLYRKLNPNWYKLRKQEKCSSLDPMNLAGCQINLIDFNFYLQKSLEIFDKKIADKFQLKKTRI